MIFFRTNVKYVNILDKVEFERFRAKVKVTVAFLVKHSHRSSALIHRPISILCHTNVKYDNILDKFELERSRVKVTVAILRKTLSLL